jgi:hypothetical protein
VYDKLDGATDKIVAAFPTADAGTVNCWIIYGSATIASTVGTNPLNRQGTVTQVNGWAADYAGQGDGSTGNYSSANTTGFPVGTTPEMAISCVFTVTSLPSAEKHFCGYGTSSNYFTLGISSGNKLTYGANFDSGFLLEVGKTYYVECGYSSGAGILYVNGAYVDGRITSTSVGNGNFRLYDFPTGGYATGIIIHYAEIRNTFRSAATIAAISNALLLPCRHDTAEIDRTLGTAIGDMTEQGGLPAAFNGLSNSQSSAACAAKTAQIGHVGKNWGAPKAIDSVIAYPSSNDGGGFDSSGTAGTITLTILGNTTDNPATAMALGQTSFADNSLGYSGVTVPAFLKAAYQYHWLKIETTVSGVLVVVAEVVFVEAVKLDIRSILPTDSIVVGRVRTDAEKVTEANDTDYKYGRREGAVGGNRRVFLGWKYVSAVTSQNVEWDNPFDTDKLNLNFVYAEDTNGKNEVGVAKGNYYGTYQNRTPSKRIRLSTTSNSTAWAYINGIAKTAGYIGCYAEVIE